MTLISVIVPVFNTDPKYIEECIESIAYVFGNNKSLNYEVMIVNDGSTDVSTIAYLKKLKLQRNWILIDQENGGLAHARNVGISKAQGKYILPLDSDDKLHIDIIEVLSRLNEGLTTDVIYGKSEHFGDENFIFIPKPILTKLHFILDGNQINATAIYTKETWEKLGGYDESFKTYEDWDFWVRCISSGADFRYFPVCFFSYRKVYDGKSMLQQTVDIADYYQSLLLNKVDVSQITKKDIFEYVGYYFKKRKIKFIYFVIYVYFTSIYKKIFRNKKIF